MNNTPLANRKSIVLVGNRNAGKSTLFNRLIGFESSIVSDIAGTTTDPVYRAIELIGYGPVKISDTAGIDDVGELGLHRVKKSEEEIRDADLIIYVISVDDIGLDFENTSFVRNESINLDENETTKVEGSKTTEIDENKIVKTKENEATKVDVEKIIKQLNILISEKTRYINSKYEDKDKIIVINKMDKLDFLKKEEIETLKKENKGIHFISNVEDNDDNLDSRLNFSWFNLLIEDIIAKLNNGEEERSLIEGLVKTGDTVLLVVPIDTEAPKGRLILPQVQMIRACLDEGIKVITCRDSELKDTIEQFPNIDLVITDSKVFKTVGDIVPQNIRITSFSILFAREKGDIDTFLEGAKKINDLNDGDKILIAESCIHTVSHEDIGQVVIPNLIKKKTNKKLEFEFSYGKSLPDNLEEFSLIIQCGGCMMTRNNMMSRVAVGKINNIPITNYGIVLAYLNGVFDRAVYK